jgi:hypothetical protein
LLFFIGYLAKYVAGTAIVDGRILSDEKGLRHAAVP